MLVKNKALYQSLIQAKQQNKKLLAILIDPDKVNLNTLDHLIIKISESPVTHIFIGGSIVTHYIIDELIVALKKKLNLPIILFPGDPSQISLHADGILFLSLISGRNPDYLIEHHVKSVSKLRSSDIEIISTGYILVDGGKETAVQRVSKTLPINRENEQQIVDTAIAGTWLGNKLIYLEAGSGALHAVPIQVINAVSKAITTPLIVGGGIKSYAQIQQAYDNGADLVVIGTAFEKDSNFFTK